MDDTALMPTQVDTVEVQEVMQILHKGAMLHRHMVVVSQVLLTEDHTQPLQALGDMEVLLI